MPRDTTPRRPDLPAPGYYKFRNTKGAHYVAARIVRSEPFYGGETATFWHVEIDGNGGGPPPVLEPWAYPDMERVYFYGVAIDEDEYNHLRALYRWAQRNDPDHPILSGKRMQKRTMKPIF